jgi:hypothetical protein
VLVVLGQGTRADHIAPGGGLALIDIDNGYDAGSTCLDVDTGGLVELECKDVLVVGKRDDELDDQLAATGDDRSARSPVSVLPVDAVVLFV